ERDDFVNAEFGGFFEKPVPAVAFGDGLQQGDFERAFAEITGAVVDGFDENFIRRNRNQVDQHAAAGAVEELDACAGAKAEHGAQVVGSGRWQGKLRGQGAGGGQGFGFDGDAAHGFYAWVEVCSKSRATHSAAWRCSVSFQPGVVKPAMTSAALSSVMPLKISLPVLGTTRAMRSSRSSSKTWGRMLATTISKFSVTSSSGVVLRTTSFWRSLATRFS